MDFEASVKDSDGYFNSSLARGAALNTSQSPRPKLFVSNDCRDEDIIQISESSGDLLFINARTPRHTIVDADSFSRCVYQSVARTLEEQDAVLLGERIFGDLRSASHILEIRRQALAPVAARAAIPPTYIEGTPCRGDGITGIHATAVRPVKSGSDRLITRDRTVCGRIVQGRDAYYLGLSDVGRLVRDGAVLPPHEEALRVLMAANRVLEDVGWSFKQVQRTWFYLNNILSWYGDFNRVRNETFRRLGMLNGGSLTRIPASTGINGRNAQGGFCTLDLIATAPIERRTHEARRLTHLRQNEATEYGSAFARGLALELENDRYVFVSGTASIDERGASVHIGDFKAQTRCTLAVVSNLLASAGATLHDIRQATAFIKSAEDVAAYQRIIEDEGLTMLPIICTIADVCRDELLFELDATAVISRSYR
jgi:enamine deaminase RidA (YjgF/YER057c/UK114 family)